MQSPTGSTPLDDQKDVKELLERKCEEGDLNPQNDADVKDESSSENRQEPPSTDQDVDALLRYDEAGSESIKRRSCD